MQRIVYILFTLYFFAGSTLLPMGDFSKVGDMAEMYLNCKATEDKDMGPEDFITQHILNLNIEDIFDGHKTNEHQSHRPLPYQHSNNTNIHIVNKTIERFSTEPIQILVKMVFGAINQQSNLKDFPSDIFRPPVA